MTVAVAQGTGFHPQTELTQTLDSNLLRTLPCLSLFWPVRSTHTCCCNRLSCSFLCFSSLAIATALNIACHLTLSEAFARTLRPVVLRWVSKQGLYWLLCNAPCFSYLPVTFSTLRSQSYAHLFVCLPAWRQKAYIRIFIDISVYIWRFAHSAAVKN